MLWGRAVIISERVNDSQWRIINPYTETLHKANQNDGLLYYESSTADTWKSLISSEATLLISDTCNIRPCPCDR